MAYRVTKDIVAITGKYKDDNNQEKNRYTKVGVLMENDNGSLMIKMEALPVGWDGFAFLNDPRESNSGGGQGRGSASPQRRQPQQQQQSRGQSGFDDLEDDIPF
jgi:single-stranded DNA-binding protein